MSVSCVYTPLAHFHWEKKMSLKLYGRRKISPKLYPSIHHFLNRILIQSAIVFVGGIALASQAHAAGNDFIQNSQNIVSMEAESGTLSGSGSEWSLNSSSSGASGGASYSAVNTNWSKGNSAVLSYDFTISTAGNYKVLLRSKRMSGGDKSLWINLDGQYLSSQSNQAAYFNHANWQWSDSHGVTTKYLSSGSHELKLYVRNAPFELDKIVVVPVTGVGSNVVNDDDTHLGPDETTPPSSGYIQNAQNIVSMEAENGTLSGNGSEWSLNSNSSGASGGESYSAVNTNWSKGSSAVLSYDFTISTAGNYKVLLRSKRMSGGDKSLWINLDGQYLSSQSNQAAYFNHANWQWSDSHGVTTKYLAQGSHELKLYVRNAPFELDKISIVPVTGVGSNVINDDDTHQGIPETYSIASNVDTDGDGVIDSADNCPSVPGPASNNGCPIPPADTDNDGVIDSEDDCPYEAGPASNNGCPLPVDTDGDGVIDSEDACPNEPGPASNDGCPIVITDTDNDGIPDSEDSCPYDAGPVSNNGCPTPITTSQWQAPTAVALANTDSTGSPKATGWSGGNHSFNTGVALHNRAFSWAGGNSYQNKSYNFTRSNYIPVQAGHLYVVSMMVRSDEEHPPIMGLQVSLRSANYSVVTEHVSRVGIGMPNEWRNAVVAIQIPDDGSVTQMRIGFNRFFDSNPRGTTGNAYIDEIKLFDYGRDAQAGSIWLKSQPKAKQAFDSGNGEITVSATGAWRLNSVPFVVKGAYPDNGGHEAESALRAYNAGFNTLYQVNPMAGQLTWAPQGMKIMADVTSVVNSPSGGLFKNWSLLESAIEDIVANYSDVVIGYYVDVENEVWESRATLQEMADRIRAKETALGSFHRPIVGHSQHVAGIEAFDHIFDLYESKDNPAFSDFGVTNTTSGAFYDTLQSSIGYITQTHPQLESTTSTAVFNIPHLGSYLDVWLIDSVIKGGSGYSIFADRPRTQTWGHPMGFTSQPWWSGINASNAAFDALYPAMEASAITEYMATVSGAPDGYSGVSKTFRVVGNEVWVMFANKGPTAVTATVTTPNDIIGFTPVWSPRSSGNQTGTRSLSVQLQPFSGYVARFTPGQ